MTSTSDYTVINNHVLVSFISYNSSPVVPWGCSLLFIYLMYLFIFIQFIKCSPIPFNWVYSFVRQWRTGVGVSLINLLYFKICKNKNTRKNKNHRLALFVNLSPPLVTTPSGHEWSYLISSYLVWNHPELAKRQEYFSHLPSLKARFCDSRDKLFFFPIWKSHSFNNNFLLHVYYKTN